MTRNAPRTRSTRISRLAGAGLLSLGLVVSSLAPALTTSAAAAPAQAEKPRRIISGWLPYWSNATSLAHVEAAADLYTDASPFWYDLHRDGSLRTKSAGTTDAVIADTVTRLHARDIPVIPTVGQHQNTPQMAALLASPTARAAHVADLVAEVREHGFDGIDLDYESMTFGGNTSDRAKVNSGFAVLAQELADALHRYGKTLSITVGPRTSDSPSSNWAVYDYAKLGAAADKFRVMTYDYGWKGGRAQAVAPLWWVEQVMQFTIARVPASKVSVGVPTYGYDWPANGNATGVTYEKAMSLQRQYGVAKVWNDQVSTHDTRPVQAPSFTYTDAKNVVHTVWYNDAASIRALVGLVGKYDLAGAALWSIGTEDPATWAALRSYGKTIAPEATTATVTTTTSKLAYGATAALQVRLVASAGRPVTSAPVTLQHRRKGGSWSAVRRGLTDDTGRASFTLTPRGGYEYRVVTLQSQDHAGTSIAVRTFRIARTLHATVGVTKVKATRTVRLAGQVTPGGTGLTVSAQRLVGKTWQTVARSKTDAKGRYVLSAKARTSGTHTYRVVVSATRDYDRGVSAAAKVTVVR